MSKFNLRKINSLLVFLVFISPFSLLARDKLNWDKETIVSLDDYEGKTFLYFMQKAVKPLNDDVARNGYRIRGSKALEVTMSNVFPSVMRKYTRGMKLEEVLRKTDELASQGKKYTAGQLKNVYGDFSFPYLVGLSSNGGVTVRINEDNWAYNIHYGSGDNEKDERTGRSFGASPKRDASDATDKEYLNDLQELIQDKSHKATYRKITEILTSCDTRDYDALSPIGQSVATDFVAVYIAEQLRNLMDKRVDSHWDAALAEVTFLSAFHAGQSELMTMVNGMLRLNVPEQHRRHITDFKFKRAQLNDYWQFGRSMEDEVDRRTGETKRVGTSRSGINVTRRDFRKLGRAISQFELKKNPNKVAKLREIFGRQYNSGNLFQDLTDFLINDRRPASLGYDAQKLTSSWVEFLEQVEQDADAITRTMRQDRRTVAELKAEQERRNRRR